MNGTKPSPVSRREFLERAASLGALAGGALVGLGNVDESWAAFDAIAGVPAEPVFNMLVVGDSIMWGQGLREPNKFSTLVARWIQAQLPGVRVQTYRFAHSGAVIKADEEKDSKPPTPGEVPNDYPSITAQVAKATSQLGASIGRENVHLVLTDGGINDVNITTILTTDPTVTNKRAWIRKLTTERCAGRMERLVPLLLTNFPNAKVVATSYFPIVSDDTDLPSLTKLLHLHQLIPDPVALITPTLRGLLGGQCRTFHETYVTGVRDAVLNARAMESVAVGLGSAPAKQAGVAGSMDSRTIALADKVARRTAFAEVPFRPENCFGGSDTWLWRMGEEDEAYVARRQQCAQVGLSGIARMICDAASISHPNVKGARAYAAAITRELTVFLPEWRAGLPLGKATAPQTRLPARIPGRP